MSTPTRQGKCDSCRIAWTWTSGVLLRDQACRACQRALRRIDRRKVGSATERVESGYTWMDMDGYRADGLANRGEK